MNYGIYLKEVRQEHNISQDKIASILGINRTTYGHYETQYQIIPLKHLVSFCNYFSVSLDYIFNFTNLKQYKKSKDSLNKTIIGQRLKEFRKANKITQIKLALELNTTKTVISGYESGRYLIATPFLYTICKKYHVSADYLLGKIDYIPN